MWLYLFVQGGLIEINYEFSALEDLSEERDTVAEHYYLFDDRRYTIDPELAEFVGRLARARTGRANRYLAYGVMLRPAPLMVHGAQEVELDYFLYNCSTTQSEYEDRGAMRVPAVLQVAWRYREESVAWLLLNVAPDERAVRLELDRPAIDGRPAMWMLTLYRDDSRANDLGLLNGPRTIDLTLPSRRLILIEARGS